MKIEGLIHEVADSIRNLYQIGDTRVFEQDLDDVEQGIENVSKTLRCIIVGWNGCEHVATQREGCDVEKLRSCETSQPLNPSTPQPLNLSTSELYVQANLVVSVYENPHDNRPGGPSLLEMAAAIAKAIDNTAAEDMTDAIHFVRITPIEKLQHGVITCDVVFRTKNNL